MGAIGRCLPLLVIGEQGEGTGHVEGGQWQDGPQQEARASQAEGQDREGRPALPGGEHAGIKRFCGPLSHPGRLGWGGGGRDP